MSMPLGWINTGSILQSLLWANIDSLFVEALDCVWQVCCMPVSTRQERLVVRFDKQLTKNCCHRMNAAKTQPSSLPELNHEDAIVSEQTQHLLADSAPDRRGEDAKGVACKLMKRSQQCYQL